MPSTAEGSASPRFIAVYAFAYASLWLALLTPAIISLALRIRELAPADPGRPISHVLFVGAAVALVSNPLFGALSDRTTSRFGRRRPWLIGGVLCGFAALVLIGFAPTITVVLVGWCIAQAAYNAVLAAMVAIVPDQVPASQRGTVVGILGICMPIGQIGGTFVVQQLSSDLTLAFAVPGIIGVFGVLLLAIVLPDERPQRVRVASTTIRASFLFAHRNFSWAWMSRVLFAMGSAFLTAYQPFFLLDDLGFAASDIPRLIFRSTLVHAALGVISSLLAGRLSDRTRRRKPFVVAGSLVQGIGLWLIAAAGSYPTFLFGVALTGMGHGIYEGVDLALVTEVLPDQDRHAAKDLGFLNIANTLPQVIAPLTAPAILDFSRGDYTLLFVVAGAVAALGSAFLLPIRNVR